MEPTGIAVEFVGSVFGDNRKLPAAGLAVLRLVVRGQHPQFGNRVGVQRDVRAAIVTGVHVRSAVNRKLVLVRASAIDIECVNSASSGNLAVEAADNARNQFDEVDDVAAVQRKVVDLLAGDEIGALAGVALQLQFARVGADAD